MDLFDMLDALGLVHEPHLCHSLVVLKVFGRPDHTTETEATPNIETKEVARLARDPACSCHVCSCFCFCCVWSGQPGSSSTEHAWHI